MAHQSVWSTICREPEITGLNVMPDLSCKINCICSFCIHILVKFRFNKTIATPNFTNYLCKILDIFLFTKNCSVYAFSQNFGPGHNKAEDSQPSRPKQFPKKAFWAVEQVISHCLDIGDVKKFSKNPQQGSGGFPLLAHYLFTYIMLSTKLSKRF